VASPSGIRKAALLLMGLEPTTAAELLKVADPEVVTRIAAELAYLCLLYTSPSPRDRTRSRMPSSA